MLVVTNTQTGDTGRYQQLSNDNSEWLTKRAPGNEWLIPR